MKSTIGLHLLMLLVLTVSQLPKIDAENKVISNNFKNSDFYQNWGVWGEWERCPEGEYATAFKIRNHPYSSKNRDNTGVNGITLYCNAPGGRSRNVSVSSSVGGFGDWGDAKDCEDGLLNSFQLSYLGYQGEGGSEVAPFYNNDDAAVIDVWFFCVGDNPETVKTGMSGGGTSNSNSKWTTKKTCLKREAVCGLKTQVSRYQKNQDNVALNNVMFECCPIVGPAATCVPSDHKDMVTECNNIQGTSPMTCSRMVSYGIMQTDKDGDKTKEDTTLSYELGINLKAEFEVLKGEFSHKYSKSDLTGHEWSTETVSTFTESTTILATFEVPAGVTTKLYQVVGECGPYEVRTFKLTRIDYDENGNTVDELPFVVDNENV